MEGPGYEAPSYGQVDDVDASAILDGARLSVFLTNRADGASEVVVDVANRSVAGLESAERVLQEVEQQRVARRDRDADRLDGRHDINQVRQLLLFDQGIEGEENLLLAGMGVTDHALQLFAVDVLGLGPGREFLEANVNRIGAEFHGSKKRLQAAGRGEELGFI